MTVFFFFQAGLQQRLSDQEEVLMKLKSELLHDALSLESLKAQKVGIIQTAVNTIVCTLLFND